MKELLRDYPVAIEIPIAWGDMDAFNHVNNKVYFKHFESARIAYFEHIGFLEFMNKTGIGPILAFTQCSFKIPLTYPDQVTVGSTVEAIKKDRFIMKHVVISHRFEKAAAFGEDILVTFDCQKNAKAPVPEEIKKRILDLENKLKLGVHE